MKRNLWLVFTLSLIAALPDGAAAADQNPALPRVLLIGDSIAAGYTPFVQEELRNTAEVVRMLQRSTPNSASDDGLEQVDEWLAGKPWAVVHFNWGLWDLRVRKDGCNNTPIERYGKNLRELVVKINRSGATPIFATTTPVPQRVLITSRRSEDVLLYNAVALKIMEESQVHVDDLYSLVLPRVSEFRHPSDVHFDEDGSRFLAKHVAASIKFMLYLRKTLRPIPRLNETRSP